MLDEKIERDTMGLVEISQIRYPLIDRLSVEQIGRLSWMDS
jgi:hypothetical protein